MPDFSRVFSWSYWFTLRPASMQTVTLFIVFGVFGALLVASVVIRILLRRNKITKRRVVFERVSRLTATMGAIGLVILFFSYEQVRLFGSRFWYVLWVLGTLVWAGCIVHFATRVLPAREAKDAVTKEKAKYLPSRHPKRRR